MSGVQRAPQTAQLSVAGGFSVSTDFFANSKISGEMMGSAIGFFFIPVLTIEQIGGQVSPGSSKPLKSTVAGFCHGFGEDAATRALRSRPNEVVPPGGVFLIRRVAPRLDSRMRLFALVWN